MLYSREKLLQLARDYCESRGVELATKLGHGMQGIVYKTSRRSAIKVHDRKDAFNLELAAYRRLEEHKVTKIREVIAVPQLRDFDEKRQIVEMTLVSPPFVLDFGAAYLDTIPEHALVPHVRAQTEIKKREMFGDDVEEVNGILADFHARYGIILVDIHPGNIRVR